MERIDDLQNNGLKIIQDDRYFCFGIDSVLLTEFARESKYIKKDSKILDIGCGTGALGILLGTKINAKKIVGIEKQEKIANLVKKTIEINKLQDKMQVINIDVKEILDKKSANEEVLNLKNEKFDIVITNPPYKKIGTGRNNKLEEKQIARYESTANIEEWLKSSNIVLKDKGLFFIVYKTERLAELMEKLRKVRLEPKRARFIYSNKDSNSNLVMIEARKNANEGMIIDKPLIIYDREGNYTEEINKIYQKEEEKNERK